jgi:hypothetical protein
MTYGTLIQTVTVGAGGQASIDFNSIPQTFTDLLLVVSARTSGTNVYEDGRIKINGSTTGYSERMLYANGSTALSASTSSTWFNWSAVNGGTSTSNTFNNVQLYFPNYTGSTNKVMMNDTVIENNAASTMMMIHAGLWSNTAAITSLSYYPSNGTIQQGSTASLYGINPIPAASLGTTPTVDYLVVAGGGGGGSSYGAGGGAGGLLTGSALSVASGSALTVTVGGGGAAGNPATNGSNSVFSSITATGGGKGGSSGSLTGGTGGSGGGGGASAGGLGTGGSGTSGQGYAGGNAAGPSYPNYGIGGGGGAGGVGGNATSGGVGGNAGPGAIITINGFSQYYAGGGAGNGYSGAGSAGSQGGVAQGVAAQPNTGSGGGGDGAAGGSGIIIIRYPVTYNPPSATTGNPAVNYINGYRVYTWYNSGSITF